jgi:hypothetical protein
MSKATIIKVPKKYLILIDGKIVDFSHSGFQATEIARYYGAEKLEVKEWTRGMSLPSRTQR